MHRSLSSVLAAAFAVAAALAPATTRALGEHHAGHGGHAGHAGADATLQLDDGKRWSTDAPLRASMERIRAALHARRAPGGSSDALAREIDEAIAHMVRNCKLPPRADATLHALIARLAAASGALREKPGSKPALDEIAAVLDLYPKYFEHPAWASANADSAR